jgi:hypothetical protein
LQKQLSPQFLQRTFNILHMKPVILLLFLGFTYLPTWAQGSFAPNADTPGTTAIAADSSVFTAWAIACEVERGPIDIAVNPPEEVTFGLPENAIGTPGSNGLISLGDGGTATLTFTEPITNGSSWDFAIFENSFNNTFLEMAFVEVSSDGLNFTRFNATSETQTDIQIDGFGAVDPTMLNNLAGKYRAFYGTPFDLAELDNIVGLDILSITHVRLVDAIGTIDPVFASYDGQGNIINDPYPTDFSSSGFDLDAIGVIHTQSSLSVQSRELTIGVYPNPTADFITVRSAFNFNQLSLYSITGKLILSKQLTAMQSDKWDISSVPPGSYILRANGNEGTGIANVIIL